MKNLFVCWLRRRWRRRGNTRALQFVAVAGVLIGGLLMGLLVSCGKEDGPGGQDNGPDEPVVTMSDDRFSVSEALQVRFAPGNLKKGGHGFVSHQYDLGGLFGWGTGVRPDLTSSDFEDYQTFYDWGTYNSGGPWRTLTWKEWQYLLTGREKAYDKFGMGIVYGVHGLILLPDQWAQPPDLDFHPGYGWWKNNYDQDQWAVMEDSGAVFLPTAGRRWETVNYFEGMDGYYWAADDQFDTPNPKMGSCMYFGEVDVGVTALPKPTGCSVRVVKEK